MVKLQQLKNRFFITVDKNLVREMGWKKGSELFFKPDREVLVLKEVRIQGEKQE